MKKILFIAPNCFPVNNAEAIVNIKLLQALCNSRKFNIDVISRNRKWYNYPSAEIESYDIKLNSLNLIEADHSINIRTVYQNILTLFNFGIIAKGSHWAFASLGTIKELIKKNNYDYVVTKSFPSLLLGYYIKKKYSIKWIATWNDPFPMVKYPEPYGKGNDSKESLITKRLIQIMRKADKHIFPSDRLMHHMQSYLKVDYKDCIIIPHVVIENNNLKRSNNKNTQLKLVHTGNLGAARDPMTFLNAYKLFINNNPNADISFTIIGKIENKYLEMINKSGLKNYVNYVEPVEYKKGLELLYDYNVAVIIEANCKEGIFLPTKVSDYMQVNIPIFSVSPKVGVLNDLFKDNYVQYFAPIDNITSIYNEIERIYRDFTNGYNIPSSNIKSEFESYKVVESYLNL